MQLCGLPEEAIGIGHTETCCGKEIKADCKEEQEGQHIQELCVPLVHQALKKGGSRIRILLKTIAADDFREKERRKTNVIITHTHGTGADCSSDLYQTGNIEEIPISDLHYIVFILENKGSKIDCSQKKEEIVCTGVGDRISGKQPLDDRIQGFAKEKNQHQED